MKNRGGKCWKWGKFRDSPCNNKNQLWECAPEGVEGAIADFVCFHCPLLASAEAKSLRMKQNLLRRKHESIIERFYSIQQMPLAHIAGGGVHPPRQHRAAAVVQADERAVLRKLLLNVV